MQIIKGESIAEFLKGCGISCDFFNYSVAAQIISYKFTLNNPKQIKSALNLAPALTNWAGVPVSLSNKKGYFIITTPTPERRAVGLADFVGLKKAPPFSVILGIDENNQPKTKTLDDLTHVLLAGTTGSGKSCALNSIIMGLCCYNSPEDLGLVLIDPKRSEFSKFAKLPHLLTNILTEPDETAAALDALIFKMEARYKILSEQGKEKNNGEFKKIVVIIDELADLVLANKSIKTKLIKLLQKARAAGIHIITATQSPRASVLDGLTLANLPTRIALTCASARESVLILGHKGAEQLTGKGDAIIKTPNNPEAVRVQFPLITTNQIKKLINQ